VPPLATGSAAAPLASSGRALHKALSQLAGTESWRLRLWDGSEHGATGPRFVISLHSWSALDRLLGALPERSFGRAYVEGSLDKGCRALWRLWRSLSSSTP
jgi:hypothetical protein